MSEPLTLYAASYRNFANQLYAAIRREAFAEDIGQTGWLTAPEHDRFLAWLAVDPSRRLLDVACGSGGPAIRACQQTGASVVGIDVREDAIETAMAQAVDAGVTQRCTFERVDASGALPFRDGSFDAVLCVDAINHLPDRARVLAEWRRVLTPTGRLVFTDPIVVTGAISADEVRARSSIGFFLFVPPGLDEDLLQRTGFVLSRTEDCTDNMALLARRWRDARAARITELEPLEGADGFHEQQRFLDLASRLADERRLSRFAFFATCAG